MVKEKYIGFDAISCVNLNKMEDWGLEILKLPICLY